MRTEIVSRLRKAGSGQTPGPGGGTTFFKGAGVITVPAGSFDAEASFAADGVNGAMVAMASLAKHSDADENSEELLSVSAIRAAAGAGSVSVFMAFSEPTSGPVRINWMAT